MDKKDETTALQNEFNNFLADIECLLKESENLTNEEFSQACEKLQDKVAVAKEPVFEISSDLSRRAHKTTSKANRAVHENPWRSAEPGVSVGQNALSKRFITAFLPRHHYREGN